MDKFIVTFKNGIKYDYSGLYTINENGEVWIVNKCRLLTIEILPNGYRRISLNKDATTKRFLLHRVVADAFLPFDEKRKWINHIDGNPANNHVSNIERCTPSENELHSYRVLGKKPVKTGTGKFGKLNVCSKPVIAIKDNIETSFESIRLAASTLNVFDSNIVKVLHGRYKHTGGYIFKYA